MKNSKYVVTWLYKRLGIQNLVPIMQTRGHQMLTKHKQAFIVEHKSKTRNDEMKDFFYFDKFF
jgi:hypothetical protein